VGDDVPPDKLGREVRVGREDHERVQCVGDGPEFHRGIDLLRTIVASGSSGPPTPHRGRRGGKTTSPVVGHIPAAGTFGATGANPHPGEPVRGEGKGVHRPPELRLQHGNQVRTHLRCQNGDVRIVMMVEW
jgi:hypothetical protein